MRKTLTVAALSVMAATAGCKDETLTGYGALGSYSLRSVSGAEGITATIVFERSGAVYGQAPCNRYTTTQTAPYPWFDIAPPAVTRMACADLDKEHLFFEALESMTEAEALGDVLILRGDGREMVWDRVAAE